MSANPSPAYEDEIDLRAIVLPLWKARWVIVIVTLAAALAAFVVSYWILPRKYQASAYVFIGQPAIEFSRSLADSGLTISPTLPDLNAVVQLVTSLNLLESVLADPAVVSAIGNEKISLSDLIDMAAAVAVGKDQLSLQITYSSPQQAVLLANTWAEKVIALVNNTYGLGSVALTLDSQVLKSQQNYDQAQAALEETLSKTKIDALIAQVASAKSDLESVLGSIIRTGSVLDDLQFFEQGLSGIPGETPLSLGDGLALTTLRQRALTVANGTFTIQIDSNSFVGFTASKALEASAQMRVGLQAQLTRLQSDQSRLEQEIPQLQRDLETANALVTQFTLKRDQSKGLYTDLYQTQQQVAVVLAESSKVASVSVEAVPPDKKSSPRVLLNTALAGMLGLILAVLWAFLQNWWRNSS